MVGKVLGVDYGARRVGVALSDATQSFAFPRALWPNDARLVERVCSLAQQEGVVEVVVGESRAYNMRDNPIAPKARSFAQQVHERCGLPVYFEPEVLTTQHARRLSEQGHAVDAVAAALILEGYLARKRGGTLEQHHMIE